jgi:hypothetical protein
MSKVLVCGLPVVDGVNGPDDYIAIRGDEAMGKVLADAHDADDRPAVFSDDALALRFTLHYGNDLRYTAPRGRWSDWDGACWRIDVSMRALDLARGVCHAVAASVDKPAIASRIASARRSNPKGSSPGSAGEAVAV